MAKVGTYYSKEVYDMLMDPKARFLFGSGGGGGGFVTSLTTTGTSGAATVVAGVLNIPQYTGTVTSLTTTGTSGAATLIGGVLNIPTYAAGTVSVTAADSTLTISPTTGAVIAGLNLGNSNTWTANQAITGTLSLTSNSNLVMKAASGVNALMGLSFVESTGSFERASFKWNPSGGNVDFGATGTGGYFARIFSGGAVALSFDTSQVATFASTINGVAGSVSTPGFKFAGESTGMYKPATNNIILCGGGANLFQAGNNLFTLSDWAAGVNQTIQPRSSGGVLDRAGMGLIITGGQSAGAGLGGFVKFQTCPAGTSGTALNTLTDRVIIDSTGLTNIVGSVAHAITTQAGGTYTISATDRTVIGTGSTSTWTFPTAVTGRELVLVNHGTGTITLGTAVTTANATTTTSLTAGSRMTIQYDGTVWRQIAG